MNIFGNKNKKEIETIKQNVEEISTTINEVKDNNNLMKKDFEEKYDELESKIKENHKKTKSVLEKQLKLIEHDDEVFQSMFDQHEKKILKISNKIDNIERLLNNLINTQNISKETVKNEPNSSKKHLYDSISKKELYSNVQLKDNRIKGDKKLFKFTIDDVISIKTHLKQYHDENLSSVAIGEMYGLANGTIQRLIYNIEEGVFDDLIKEYQSQNDNSKSHKIDIAECYRVKQHRTMDDDGTLFSSKGRAPYNIKDIILLKEAINNENNKTAGEVLKDFSYAHPTGCKLIWSIEEGCFDELIRRWNAKKFNTIPTQKKQKKKKHLRKVSKSLQQPLPKSTQLNEDGSFYNGNKNLSYTIYDVITMKNRIPNFDKYPSFEDLAEDFDLTITSIKVMIWRIEEGYFDNMIKEYLSRTYSYKNNFNRLFINGEDTGLSINKCISMVECIINNPNKAKTVNNLIKMYPTINSKYIRIIAEEYNNPNLSKILKKEIKEVERIDNPQKRREQGVFL